MNLAQMIPLGVSLLQASLPALSKVFGQDKSTMISKAVDFVVEVAPIVAKEYKDMVPVVQNIIMALKSEPGTHMAQLDALEEAEKTLDLNFDDAAAAALAEDNAAGA